MILLESEVGTSSQSLGSFSGLFQCSTHDPVFAIVALFLVRQMGVVCAHPNSHPVLAPRFEQSTPGNGDPTRADERYTNLEYLQDSGTTRSRIVWVQCLTRRPSCARSRLIIYRIINSKASYSTYPYGLISQRFAIHPPLRFEYGFDDVTRFTVYHSIRHIVA